MAARCPSCGSRRQQPRSRAGTGAVSPLPCSIHPQAPGWRGRHPPPCAPPPRSHPCVPARHSRGAGRQSPAGGRAPTRTPEPLALKLRGGLGRAVGSGVPDPDPAFVGCRTVPPGVAAAPPLPRSHGAGAVGARVPLRAHPARRSRWGTGQRVPGTVRRPRSPASPGLCQSPKPGCTPLQSCASEGVRGCGVGVRGGQLCPLLSDKTPPAWRGEEHDAVFCRSERVSQTPSCPPKHLLLLQPGTRGDGGGLTLPSRSPRSGKYPLPEPGRIPRTPLLSPNASTGDLSFPRSVRGRGGELEVRGVRSRRGGMLRGCDCTGKELGAKRGRVWGSSATAWPGCGRRVLPSDALR